MTALILQNAGTGQSSFMVIKHVVCRGVLAGRRAGNPQLAMAAMEARPGCGITQVD
jgi:hypothetical protein